MSGGKHQAEREIFIVFCIKTSISWGGDPGVGVQMLIREQQGGLPLAAFPPCHMQALLRVPSDPQVQGEQ